MCPSLKIALMKMVPAVDKVPTPPSWLYCVVARKMALGLIVLPGRAEMTTVVDGGFPRPATAAKLGSVKC